MNTITLIDPTDGGVMEVPVHDAHAVYEPVNMIDEQFSILQYALKYVRYPHGSYHAAFLLAHFAFELYPELRG
jgi:hypothetical protein